MFGHTCFIPLDIPVCLIHICIEGPMLSKRYNSMDVAENEGDAERDGSIRIVDLVQGLRI